MTSRDQILAALGAAPAAEEIPPAGRYSKPLSEPIWDAFVREFEALGAEVKTVADLTSLSEWRVFIDPDVPAEYRKGLFETSEIWEAEIGLTLADGAVAETGSLILNSGQNRHRLASLTPPHHVVLLSRSKVYATLEDAFDQGFGRTAVFITGSSRTADIEGILVRGIHGPKRLWVIPIP